MDDGSDKPIALSSCMLRERMLKECLAIVFGSRCSTTFSLAVNSQSTPTISHCKHLFSESRPVPAMASARMQRWALTLNAYKYTITYKSGANHANADVLSRLPLSAVPLPLPGETILLVDTLQGSPVPFHYTDQTID